MYGGIIKSEGLHQVESQTLPPSTSESRMFARSLAALVPLLPDYPRSNHRTLLV